jgi:CubicO group peptidase (beta-lactamase class C family)
VQLATPEHDASLYLARYGWSGGLGTVWYSWPDKRAAVVLLTQVLPPSAQLIRALLLQRTRSAYLPSIRY